MKALRRQAKAAVFNNRGFVLRVLIRTRPEVSELVYCDWSAATLEMATLESITSTSHVRATVPGSIWT